MAGAGQRQVESIAGQIAGMLRVLPTANVMPAQLKSQPLAIRWPPALIVIAASPGLVLVWVKDQGNRIKTT